MKQTDEDRLAAWTVRDSEVVLQTPWFTIRKQSMRTPRDTDVQHYVHEGPDSVICVCVTSDERVLVERQWRPAIGRVSVDYPAGRMEGDDPSAKAAVLRELREETGYEVSSLRKLGVVDREPAFSATRVHVFLAHGAVPGRDAPDENESIVAAFVPASRVLAMILSGEMCCAFCLSATLLAFQELGWLRAGLARA